LQKQASKFEKQAKNR